MELIEKHNLGSLFLLWFGAAISIAEIVTGTLIAPLGWRSGILAIIVGHLIGCFLFLWPAGYISAKNRQTAIQVTKLTFGRNGVIIFSLLNALQLLGWTAVMIVYAQQAMNTISQILFNYQSILVMSVIVAFLIIVWLLFDSNWLFKINNIIVILLAIGMFIFLLTIMQHQSLHSLHLSTISFGNAVELNITMSLSWLPLIGDYTRQTTQPLKTSLISVSGYFFGGVAMFLLGMAIVLVTGQADFNAALAQSHLGLWALLLVIFATVTTTFLDAYSAATNIANIFPIRKINWLAIWITLGGLLIAIFVSMKYYENFLDAIGAVFTPMFAILFVSVFLMKKRLARSLNFIWWIIGILSYSTLQLLEFPLGTTSLLLILVSIGVYLTSRLTSTYSLKN